MLIYLLLPRRELRVDVEYSVLVGAFLLLATDIYTPENNILIINKV